MRKSSGAVLNSFQTRLLVTFIVGAVLLSFSLDYFYPQVVRGTWDNLAQKIASSNPQIKRQADVIELCQQYNLAWYYQTDVVGKPLKTAFAITPDLTVHRNNSGLITWRGSDYYEAVQELPGNKLLHVGFPARPLFDLTLDSPVPLIVMLMLVFGLFLMTLFTYKVSMGTAFNRLILILEAARRGQRFEKPDLRLAASEVNKIAYLVDQIARDTVALQDKLKSTEDNLTITLAKYHDLLSDAKRDRSLLAIKHAESTFLDELIKDLDQQANSTDACAAVLQKLINEFPSLFEYALFFTLNKNGTASLNAHLGFQKNPVDVIAGIVDPRKGLLVEPPHEVTVIPYDSLKQQVAKHLCDLTSSDSILFVPFEFQARKLGWLVIFTNQQQTQLDNFLRILRRVSATAATALSHVITQEEHMMAIRTDELTQLPNRNFLFELLPRILQSNAGGQPTSFCFFLLDALGLGAINEAHGRLTGDAMIRELATRLTKILHERQHQKDIVYHDFVIRLQASQFLLIVEGMTQRQAIMYAQRIRQQINQTPWPDGSREWTMATGIASYPEDAASAENILQQVEIALAYASGQAGPEKITTISQVPQAFRSLRSSSNLGGSLDVFDPASLLQSLSLSQKSGVLTVTQKDGKQFWTFLDQGRPTKARLANLKGTAAIVEFLTLFDSGEFNFAETANIDSSTLENIKRLDDSFNCLKGLERTLMDGALANDNYKAAKSTLKSLDFYVWPLPEEELEEAFTRLKSLKEPPLPDEEQAMRQIIKLSAGNIKLSAIFQKLDMEPTYLLWRAAALLVDHGIVQLKKLATNAK